MAVYLDEDEVWKCLKHPSKRRRSGICPICLRDRLVSLCPECANVRPCSCCAATTTSSSSSSASSSFSRFSSAGESAAVGTIGRVRNLIDSEPAFRRSRSVGIPFLRSRSRLVSIDGDAKPEAVLKDSFPPSMPSNKIKPATSFWSVFKLNRSNKSGLREQAPGKAIEVGEYENGSRRPVMVRSRSVAVPAVAVDGEREYRATPKGKSWYFPSPIKVFRQYKVSKAVQQQRSPLYRG